MRGAGLGLVWGVALLIGGGGTAVQAQQSGDAPDLLLVRCAERSALACLTTTVDLPAATARSLARGQSGIDTAWRARVRGDTAVPAFGFRRLAERPRPARVLLLVDVSGSMKNLGIGTAKIVIKDNLLRPLDSIGRGAVQVAVAPFGSIDVERRIAGARFESPAAAMDRVEALPAPDRENTGLYSAVSAGVRRLADELAKAGPDALGLLIVLTDGDNDVGGVEDDPGLLEGESGLGQAARTVSEGPVIPWIIGIGSRVSSRPLQALAGTKGRSYVVPLDAYRLAQPLAETRTLFASAWELTFRLPRGGREELGRGWLAVGLRHPLGGAANLAAPVWRPPVIALPAFSGSAAAGVVPSALAPGRLSGILDRRVPLLLFVLVTLLLLWLAVPRLLWPRVVPAGAAPAEGRKKAPRSAGGLRTDVREAPPRRPTDVTASKARPAQ